VYQHERRSAEHGRWIQENSDMSMTIRAHFDGKVLVPDEPLELPVDQPLEIEVHLPSSEVIILPRPLPPAGKPPYPLHGTPIRYDRPTDPVADEDWEAVKRGACNARDGIAIDPT
jgi:hypothetical protein